MFFPSKFGGKTSSILLLLSELHSTGDADAAGGMVMAAGGTMLMRQRQERVNGGKGRDADAEGKGQRWLRKAGTAGERAREGALW